MDRDGLLQRAACVAQVLVGDLDNPVLSDDDHKHIAKVLRVRDGEQIALIDGDGQWCIGEWQSARVNRVTDLVFDPPPTPEITIWIAPVKGDRPEWTVQKLTEIGVDCIGILTKTDHAVVRWDAEKVVKNLGRLSRVAYEASMQSRRTRLPKLITATSLSQLEGTFAIGHPGGEEVSLDHTSIAVGPEGGWSEAELRLGKSRVDLGSTVLRAETAALAAGVRLSALRDR